MPTFGRTQDIEHVIGPSGRLDLAVTSADITIRATDDQTARVRATFELSAGSDEEADAVFARVRLLATPGEGHLIVAEPDRPPSLGGVISRILGGRPDVDLAVEVDLPRRAELRLETVSGEVTASGLRGEQRYTTVSGDLYLSDGGGALRVKSVSGDVTVRAVEPVSLRADAVSGDVVLSAPRVDGLRLHGVSGDVSVEGLLAPAGEFRLDTVSGDASIGIAGGATFEVRGISSDISSDIDHRLEGPEDRRRLIIGSGVPTVVFSTLSGDLSVHRARHTPTELDAPAPAAPAVVPEAEQLAILQALERGEMDVDEAARRLAGGVSDA